MWGQNWNTMIWGGVGAGAVPALGFWLTLLLGVALGATGLFLVRKGHTRTVVLLGVVLVVVAPISAVAVPFTFSNGTTADATQVNANFASVTPVTGFSYVNGSPTGGAVWPILGTAFTAPRTMVCTVTTTVTTTLSETVAGVAILFPSISENASLSFASGAPIGGTPVVYLMPAAGTGVYQATQTVQYSVGSGLSVAFGVQMNTTGNFATSATNWKMYVVYSCV
jgi:hypothetical protein